MSLVLLLPSALVGLVALALPIAIHLARRSEQRPTPFAAMRWLAGPARPRRRLRIESPWLLLLRLLLVVAIVVLLAQPALRGAWPDTRARVFVAPDVDIEQARAAVPDADARWHWLADDWPSIDAARPAPPASLGSVVRDIDASLPSATPITVVVPAQVGGLDGERLRLRHAIDWRVVGDAVGRESRATGADGPRVLSVRTAADAQRAVDYLRGAVAAWNVREPGRHALDAAAIGAALPPNTNALVWLGAPVDDRLRAWVRNGGVAVVDTAGVAERDARPATAIWRAPDGRVLAHARSLGRGRLIELAGPFAPASLPELLEPTFPQQLDALLRGGDRAPRRAVATAIAPLRSDVDIATPTTPLDGAFALAIAALCVVERLVALRQRREWRP